MRQSIFIGKLAEKPELRHTPAGTPVTTVTLKVLEKQGEGWSEHRFRVTVWSEAALRLCRQAQKGSELVAVCRPESREYTDREGRKRLSQEHVASWVRVCVPAEDSDLPVRDADASGPGF